MPLQADQLIHALIWIARYVAWNLYAHSSMEMVPVHAAYNKSNIVQWFDLAQLECKKKSSSSVLNI